MSNEQFIKGLEQFIADFKPFCGNKEDWKRVYDALDQLKEQEPKTVLHREDGDYCPRCSTINTRVMGVQKLHLGTRYCPYCGQAVRWEVDE